MMIILNPMAGGERAMERWAAFCTAGRCREIDRADIVLTGGPGIDEAVVDALSRGEERFVAAGGDGTVNALLNALMAHRDDRSFRDVALGAIGLGSSNDFHKGPEGGTQGPTPARIDFGRVKRQDVGCLDATGTAGTVRRHFIVNASVGLTAEGNEVFNRPTGPVAMLKRLGAQAAIPAAAFLAIARHTNIGVQVSVDGRPERPALISNLSVLKNPNISGPIRLDDGCPIDDGRLGLWLEEGRSRLSLLGLFLNLASGRFTPGTGTTLSRCASLRVRAPHPFPVEFDGEIIHAREATFTVIRNAIGVCQ